MTLRVIKVMMEMRYSSREQSHSRRPVRVSMICLFSEMTDSSVRDLGQGLFGCWLAVTVQTEGALGKSRLRISSPTAKQQLGTLGILLRLLLPPAGRPQSNAELGVVEVKSESDIDTGMSPKSLGVVTVVWRLESTELDSE
jgi:hypothetical protein